MNNNFSFCLLSCSQVSFSKFYFVYLSNKENPTLVNFSSDALVCFQNWDPLPMEFTLKWFRRNISENSVKDHNDRTDNHILKFSISTMGNVERTVWRICIMILRCNGLKKNHFRFRFCLFKYLNLIFNLQLWKMKYI